MFSLLKQTLIRGRSLVPMIFLGMGQCRNCPSLCFFSVLIVFGATVSPWPLIIERSCLPCGRPFHPRNERPCPYPVPADSTRESRRRLCRPDACRVPQRSKEWFPRLPP